jgi:putative transposase
MALDAEMTEYRFITSIPGGRDSGISCNGSRAKTVLAEIGSVELEVSRGTAVHLIRRSFWSASTA